MEDRWMVCYESKPRESTQPWLWTVSRFMLKSQAMGMYNRLLPGPNGSFGPIEYRKITIAEIMTTHEEDK